MKKLCRIAGLVVASWLAVPSDDCGGDPNYLLPDLFPFVDEDYQYLQNWQIQGNAIRIQTVFSNIGDGLFQIRQDNPGPVGQPTPITQRIFIDVDNGPVYEDFPVNTAIYQGDGLIHFEDYTEFQLLEATVDDGILGVGAVVSNHVKTSHNLVHSFRLPGPEWSDAPAYQTTNRSVYQNVSRGWADVYSHGSTHQFIPLTGVSFGPRYWLRQIIDPTDVIRETDETNNMAQVLIDLNEVGQAFFNPDGTFVQPGDPVPAEPGDLNGDGVLDIQDWLAFRDRFETDLTGLLPPEALLAGDLNLDGAHTIEDFVIFRDYYEAANGDGSFAALSAPELGSVALAAIGLFAIVVGWSLRKTSRAR